MGLRCCLLHLIKQNCLLKTFLRALDDSGISLHVFPSRTHLKLHISVTPKMIKKVIMNLNFSKTSGLDCIPYQYGLGLLNQLQIFSQLCLIELLGLLIGLGANRAVALDISTAFDRVSHVGLLHKLKSYRISSQIFGLTSSFLRNRRLRVIRHLICGNNLNWLLNFNLIYETLWAGVRSGLLILMVGKLSFFHLTGLITMVLLM